MSRAREIAEERLAKGEISEEDFQNIIKTLSSSHVGNEQPNPTRELYTEATSTPNVHNLQSGQHEIESELEYVGFWARLGALLIDTLLIMAVTAPILTLVYGPSYWTSEIIFHGPLDFLISIIFPAVAIIMFWESVQASPGKMAVSAKIVDAKTGLAPSTGQLVGRYFAYILSAIPLGLGYFWIAFDERKQGWHDKISGTLVVRRKKQNVDSVVFR